MLYLVIGIWKLCILLLSSKKRIFFVNQVVDDNDIHSIVMSYLLHNCFNETADSLASCTGVKQPAIDRDNLERRKREFNYSFIDCLLCDYML